METIKLSTEDCDVIASGSVIVPNGRGLLFELPENLKFKIVFADKPDDPSDNSYHIEEIDGGSVLQITFYNVMNSHFGSPKQMVKLALLNGKLLSLGFSLLSINNVEKREDRIFFYTWYLSKESYKEGDA